MQERIQEEDIVFILANFAFTFAEGVDLKKRSCKSKSVSASHMKNDFIAPCFCERVVLNHRQAGWVSRYCPTPPPPELQQLALVSYVCECLHLVSELNLHGDNLESH